MLAYGLISVVTTFLKQSYLCEELLLENSLILLSFDIMWLIFTARRGYVSAVLGVVILSVCLLRTRLQVSVDATIRHYYSCV